MTLDWYLDERGVTHAQVDVAMTLPKVLFCSMRGWNAQRVLVECAWRFPVTCLFCMRGFLRARRS